MMRPPRAGGLALHGMRAQRGPHPAAGSTLTGRRRLWPWLFACLAVLAAVMAILLLPGGKPPAPPAISTPHVRPPAVKAPAPPEVPTAPPLGVPNVDAPGVSVPRLHRPHVGTPRADIGGPSVGTPHVDVGSPSVKTPELDRPSGGISFGWLTDFFSISWRVIWILLTLPWWLVLLTVLCGRWFWIAWKRRREREEEADSDETGTTSGRAAS